MRINILLLPLLGGYLFIKNTFYFGLRAIRYNNQELLLSSAAAGLCALVPSYFITKILSSYAPEFTNSWSNILNFEYSGTALTALIILILAIFVERSFHEEESQIIKIIREDKDAIELILLKALQEEKLISITLKNNKVYVGFISQAFFPPYKNLQSLKIIPVISGYRKEENMHVIFTTVYDHIVNFVDRNETINLDIDDFQIGIPLSEITSVNIFDFRVYDLFQSTDVSQSQSNFK